MSEAKHIYFKIDAQNLTFHRALPRVTKGKSILATIETTKQTGNSRSMGYRISYDHAGCAQRVGGFSKEGVRR